VSVEKEGEMYTWKTLSLGESKGLVGERVGWGDVYQGNKLKKKH